MDEQDLMPILGLPVPESLPLALGYQGPSRYLAVIQQGRHVHGTTWDDGRLTGPVYLDAFLRYLRHPRVARFARALHLEEGKSALLLDVEQGRAWVGDANTVRRYACNHAAHDNENMMSELFSADELESIATYGPTSSELDTIKRYMLDGNAMSTTAPCGEPAIREAMRDMLCELSIQY